jgi:hypothetical protein
MASVIQSPTTLRTWSVSMDKPRTIADDAEGMEEIYTELLGNRGRQRPS